MALMLNGCTTDRTAETASSEKVVNVYNWADYIAPDTLKKFESEYGVKVNYDIYDSSEVADVKLMAGGSGYDVVVHSSQFSSRLAPIGTFEKLDYSRLDNMWHLDRDLIARTDVYEKTRGYAISVPLGYDGIRLQRRACARVITRSSDG
jgi:putrescine transport system substrate-binding protein